MFPRTASLDLRTCEIKSIDDLDAETVAKHYLGGRGLGTFLYTRLAKWGVSPLDAENPMVFAAGSLTGTAYPATARSTLTSRSPQTQTISTSNCGGYWGASLRKLGYDALVLNHAAPEWSILHLYSDHAVLEPAGEYMGQNIDEVEGSLREQFPKAAVAGIGPAGENKVIFASITHNYDNDFGRGGLGAVMASKKLKSIVLHNPAIKKIIPIKNAEDHKKSSRSITEHLKQSEAFPFYREHGTLHFLSVYTSRAGQTVRYFERNTDPGFAEFNQHELVKRVVKRKSCSKCPMACRHSLRIVADGEDGSKNISRSPEYESITLLGPNLGIFDSEHVLRANEEATQLGMDTMSAGQAIACYVKASQDGLFKPEDENGRTVEFGNVKLYEFLPEIAHRKGVGDLIANGSDAIAEAAGNPDVSLAVKGMDPSAYDPRRFTGQGLGYGVSSRGACHLRGGATVSMEALERPAPINGKAYRGKGATVGFSVSAATLFDSLGICVHSYGSYVNLHLLARLTPKPIIKLMMTATARLGLMFVGLKPIQEALLTTLGMEMSKGDLMQTAKRIVTLERIYNNAMGFTDKDDMLPNRFFEEKTESNAALSRRKYRRELLDYYKFMGWDKNGIPTDKCIRELGLEWACELAKTAVTPVET